jgi:hypothetical protein
VKELREVLTRPAVYPQRNTEARSCHNCYHRKGISITYSERVPVVLLSSMQHACAVLYIYIYIYSSCKVHIILVSFLSNLNFIDRFSQKAQMSNFMKIRPVVAEFCMRVDGRTDRHD